MKIILILAGFIMLASCTATPEAGFSYSPKEPTAGEMVRFTNRSVNTTSSEWDFGDGITSSHTSTNHIYEEAGFYTVTLKAQKGSSSDTKTVTIEVFP